MPLLDIDGSVDLTLTWRIDAPRPRLWQCLTDADLLHQWLGDIVEGTVESGAEFVVDHGGGYCCRSTVVHLSEPTELHLTWHFPDEPPSRVSFALDATDDATDVRLTHSALGDLVGSYRDGWCVHLTYLEAAGLGTPLPPSMFWRLHGTIAHLTGRPVSARER